MTHAAPAPRVGGRPLWQRLWRRAGRLLRRVAGHVIWPRYRCLPLGRFRRYVDVKDGLFGGWIAAEGRYEEHLTAALVAALRPGDTFLDLGANMGYFTMLAASLVGPGGRVLAFEPRHDNVALLHLSARENGFGQ